MGVLELILAAAIILDLIFHVRLYKLKNEIKDLEKDMDDIEEDIVDEFKLVNESIQSNGNMMVAYINDKIASLTPVKKLKVKVLKKK